MAALRRCVAPLLQGQQMSVGCQQFTIHPLLRNQSLMALPAASNNLLKALSQSLILDTRSFSCSVVRCRFESPRSTDLSDTSDKPEAAQPFDANLVNSLSQNMNGDLPLSDMPDPFVKDYRRCFLCKQNVKLDHKNVRLLSQFVSPYTGRIYGRAVTGLCIPMQKHVARMIKRARVSGYMPFILKDPKYLQDPQPFDPMARQKV